MPVPAPAVQPGPAPVSLFYSYAHEDEKLRDDLERHLKILEHKRLIQPWHDRAIVPGRSWDTEIDLHLQQAELILLLLSAYFIGSDYIVGKELKTAMQRHAEGSATVVPIMLRPVDLQPEDAEALPFVGLLAPQGLPRDLKPVTSWRQREQAWVAVANGLRATVKQIHARRAPAPPARLAEASPGLSALLAKPFGAAPPPPAGDPLLDRVVDEFARELQAAQASKGGAPLSPAGMREHAMRLIDAPEQRRVLWVDDHPDHNLFEAAALAKLQIEVRSVRSSDEALACLAAEPEPVDLVISDWARDVDGPQAALSLLARLRGAGWGMPVLVYHAGFDPVLRQARAEAARAAGVAGEAVLPDQLLALVMRALGLAD